METTLETPSIADLAPTESLERTQDAVKSNATETAGEGCPLQGGSWRGSSDPLESPNYEEAMRKWVEEGGLKSQGPEETHQPTEDFASPLVTRLRTAGSRKQVLEVASDYLMELLGGEESAASDGGGIRAEEGHVAEGEGGQVDLGFDQLMQIIPALTELCDADMAAGVADDVADDVETPGLLDETQGVRLLGGVCRALAPIGEAVVWLTELCENARFESDGGHSIDGFGSQRSDLLDENERPVPGGFDGVEYLAPHQELPTETGTNPNAPSSKPLPAVGKEPAGDASQSRIEREPAVVTGDAAGDDVAAQRDDLAAPAGDDVASELTDVAQVQAAVELVQLGVAMFTTAERLVERRKGSWAVLAGDKSLHATLARFRHHVANLLGAFGRVRTVAGRPDHLLACLVVLCEELRRTGFRVLDDTDGRRTRDDWGSDARNPGQENGADPATESGLDAKEGSKPDENAESGGRGVGLSPRTLDDHATGVQAMRRNSDGGLVGEETVSDAREALDGTTVSDKEKGVSGRYQRDGSIAEDERPVDGQGADLPAETAPRTRVGRNRKAPSAWWEAAPAADGTAAFSVRKVGKSVSESVQKKRKSASESAGKDTGPSESVRTVEGPSGSSGRTSEGSLETRPEAADEVVVEIGGEGAEIDLEEEEIRYDKRSKRRRKALSYKRRKAQARAPSQNRFVAYAIEEQMLDSESEWDSDQYSDLEDFIALENEDVDFKTMPLSTITPYVPYGDADEDAALGAQALSAQAPEQEGQVLATA